MLKIRLARVGKKKKPVYRLVVSEHTKDMYGDHLENLGQYNPHTKEVVLKNDRTEHWLKVGAQPSETVANLLTEQGVIKQDKKAKAVAISKKRQTKLGAKAEEAKAKEVEAKEVASVEEEKPAEEKVEEASVEEKVEEEKTEDKPTEEKTEEKKEEAEITEEDKK